MPRCARAHAPGNLVHFISRFVDRRFLLDDVGRSVYLRQLDRALARSDWSLVSYSLMSSHVHLGLVAGESSLASWVHGMHLQFALWLNRQLSADDPTRLGPVFADRPKTGVMDLSRAGSLIAYHHNNPVRAGVVSNALTSTWTSHRAYLGLVRGPRCLDVSLGLTLCGFAPDAEGRLRFHDHVGGSVAQGHEGASPTEICTRPPRPPLRPAALTPADVVERVCTATGRTRPQVLGSDRSVEAANARRAALRVWRELGGSAGSMAAELEVSRTAAYRLLETAYARTREDRRAEAILEALREHPGGDASRDNPPA